MVAFYGQPIQATYLLRGLRLPKVWTIARTRHVYETCVAISRACAAAEERHTAFGGYQEMTIVPLPGGAAPPRSLTCVAPFSTNDEPPPPPPPPP